MTLVGSTFYGTADNGGANNFGTVFSVPITGGTPSVLGSFTASEGQASNDALTLVGSTLYGATFDSGEQNEGIIFTVPLSGGAPTEIAFFNLTDGGAPHGNFRLIGSTLYGTANNGGSSPAGAGTIFSVPLAGGTPTAIASFNGTNGRDPGGDLTLVGSTLYGSTSRGGANVAGTVFSVPLAGGTPTVLATFNGADGGSVNNLILIGSTFFGTTNQGGAFHDGTVFSVPLAGGTPTVLASFNGTNGSGPVGDLTLVGSTLYGSTRQGGAGGFGTVFALSISASATADMTNNSSSFGPAVGQTVPQGTGYAGIGSMVTSTVGTGGGPMLGTSAALLAGSNTGNFTGGSANVSMGWRTRTLQETTVWEGGTPSSPPLPKPDSTLISDVLNLTGLSSSSSEPAKTDPYVLQMSYDPSLLNNEAAQAAGRSIYLAWLNPSGGPGGVPLWQSATLANFGNDATAAEQGFLGSFGTFQFDFGDPNISDYIGAWGIDTADHDVWAVLNHESDFAVVPEPSSIILLSIAAICGALFGIRSKLYGNSLRSRTGPSARYLSLRSCGGAVRDLRHANDGRRLA